LSGDQYLEGERNSHVGREEEASGAGEVSEMKKETKRKDVKKIKIWRRINRNEIEEK
jgi:hypothetical protein